MLPPQPSSTPLASYPGWAWVRGYYPPCFHPSPTAMLPPPMLPPQPHPHAPTLLSLCLTPMLCLVSVPDSRTVPMFSRELHVASLVPRPYATWNRVWERGLDLLHCGHVSRVLVPSRKGPRATSSRQGYVVINDLWVSVSGCSRPVKSIELTWDVYH